MVFLHKFLLIPLSIVLFCKNTSGFNFTNVNGTWIVRQTSNPVEATTCSFVNINKTSDQTVFEYQSYNASAYKLVVNTSSTNVYPVKDSKNVPGNLTIHGGILPLFIVASVKIKGENATYLVLTRRAQLADDDMEKNITDILESIPDVKKIRLNSTRPESPGCRKFFKEKYEDFNHSYPNVPQQVITWPSTTTIKPVISSTTTITTKKPGKNNKNAGSVLYISNLVVALSFIFVFTN